MKSRQVNLYRWFLQEIGDCAVYSEIFVIDRGDNKRRKVSELKQILFKLNGIKPENHKFFTISGREEFRGFALSYGCKD